MLLSCSLFVGKDVFADEKGMKIPERMQSNSKIENIFQIQYKNICGGKVSSDQYNLNGPTEEQSLADANLAREEGVKIPERMQPNSKIEYISQNQYEIINGGKVSSDQYNLNGLTEEEQKFADLNIAWAEGLDLSEIDFHHNPAPELGMVVIYDEFGFIEEIQNSKMPYANKYNPLPSGTTSSFGNHVWGSFNNTLSVTTSQVRGVGRMTYFSDVKGENDNNLKKGDVATKGEKDNPVYNTQIYVTVQRPNSSRYTTQTMYKRDNGNLENAILDIWKTGVEYFGYYYNQDKNESNFDPKEAVYFYNR